MCNQFSSDLLGPFPIHSGVTSGYTSWWISFSFESPYEKALQTALQRVKQHSLKPNEIGSKGKTALSCSKPVFPSASKILGIGDSMGIHIYDLASWQQEDSHAAKISGECGGKPTQNQIAVVDNTSGYLLSCSYAC